MKIDYENEKSLCGYLISYYRQFQNISIYDILYNNGKYYHENCIMCNRCKKKEMICSFKTIQKIEHGSVVKNECIYYRLYENLNKKIVFDRTLLSKLEVLGKTLYNALCENSYNKSYELLFTITDESKKYQQYIYIGELLNLYFDILNLKMNKVYPPKERISLYLFLVNKISGENTKLLLYLLYRVTYQNKEMFEYKQSVLFSLTSYLDDPLFFNIKIKNLIENNSLCAYSELKQLSLNNTDFNEYQKYIIQNHLSYIEMNYSLFDSAYSTMKYCIEIIEKSEFRPFVDTVSYRQMGTVAYAAKKYDEVIKYLMKVKNSGNPLQIQAALLFKSLEITNQIESLKNLIDHTNISLIVNEFEKKFTIYYKMKYQSQNLSKKEMIYLEEYICEELKPIADLIGEFFKEIILEDLLYFVNNTTNYKKLYVFEKTK